MAKEKEKKIDDKKINKCNCNEDCTCGCQEGKECTCDENKCNCECNDECKCNDSNEVESLKNEILDLQTKIMYQQAELINYRKRRDEQEELYKKYQNEDLLYDLTEMIDNFDRALSVKTDNKEVNNMLVGIKMINDQFNQILKKYGIVEIEALNYPFDENYMEALEITEDESKPDEIVTKVLRKGYKYKDKVLKHAQVVVNKNKKIENKKGND